MHEYLPVIIFLMALVTFIGGGLIWVFVILPRHTHALYERLQSELRSKGYHRIETHDPALLTTMKSLAPFTTSFSIKSKGGWEEPPRIQEALIMNSPRAVRYLANGNRIMKVRFWGWSTYSVGGTILVEVRPTSLEGESYVTQKYTAEVGVAEYFEEVYGMKQITHGLDKEFTKRFSVYSPGGKTVIVPARLQKILLDNLPFFFNVVGSERWYGSSRLDNPWYFNIKFSPQGWGISCTEIRDREIMQELLRLADQIAEAVQKG